MTLFSFHKRWVVLVLGLPGIILPQWAGESSAGYSELSTTMRMGEVYENSNYTLSGVQHNRSGLISSVAPGIDLSHFWKELTLRTGYRIESNFYHSRPEYNYFRHNGELGIEVESDISRSLSVEIGENVSYAGDVGGVSSENREFGEETGDGILQVRTTTLANSLSFGLNHRISSRFNVGLTASETHLMYPDTDDNIDTRIDSLGFSWGYTFSPAHSFTLNYGYTNYSFQVYDYTFDATEGVNNRGSYHLNLGLGKTISPTLSLTLSAGGVYTPEPETTYNWTGGLGLVKEFQTVSITISMDRGEDHASGLINTTTINERGSVGAAYQMDDTFTITINGDASERRSEPSGLLDITTYSGGIEGEWRFLSWLTITFGYSNSRQYSNGSVGEDFSSDRLFFNLDIIPEEKRF